MDVCRGVFRAVGPVVLGLGLFTLPLLFTPTQAEAVDPEDCGGFETVECQTSEWCIGIRWLGFQYCESDTIYWPAPSGYVGGGFGGGGGGAF